MLLNTFQVDLKPGDPEPFPDVRGFAKVGPAADGGREAEHAFVLDKFPGKSRRRLSISGGRRRGYGGP